MPVGTQGTVKAMLPEEVAQTGARVVLGNTYHLWLRPGQDVIESLGGLHGFTRWPHAMLTDSGGFQAFSLADKCKRGDDGYEFRSHLDGDRKHLSPEGAMQIQRAIGADIAMQLDVCPPGGADRRDVEEACRVTTAWAERCLEERRRLDEAGKTPQAVFGIIQGGSDPELRIAHAQEIAAMPFEGLALGGFSVGEPIQRMYEVLEEVTPHVDPHRARYLMGVGKPQDLVVAIGAGVDMFDCVLPTRNARGGHLLTQTGRIAIKNAKFKADASVLEPGCPCPTCLGGYSRGYLRHLYLSNELLAFRLFSMHNLHLYGRLVAEAREAIIDRRYGSYRRDVLDRLSRDVPGNLT
jgi:queuine tRNA-ribosyltransferase